MLCRYCLKEFASDKSLVQHQARCVALADARACGRADAPLYSELWQTVVILQRQVSSLTSKVAKLQEQAGRANRKLNVKDWLTKQAGYLLYDDWLPGVRFSEGNLQAILSGDYMTELVAALPDADRAFASFTQKNDRLYVRDASEWQEFDDERLDRLLGVCSQALLAEFTETGLSDEDYLLGVQSLLAKSGGKVTQRRAFRKAMAKRVRVDLKKVAEYDFGDLPERVATAHHHTD